MAAMPADDGLTNGCSTIGISKSPPVEIMEQAFRCFTGNMPCAKGRAARENIAAASAWSYEVELLRGEARASFVMDHGRFGPQGVLGGGDGGKNRVTVFRDDKAYVPAHLSKEQDIPLKAGDRVRVETPRRRLRRSHRARPGVDPS
jgi:N-methylhydantoinase B